MTVPELLAPAGGFRQLDAALRFGADAVYLGLDAFGMRAHAGNFNHETLKDAVRQAHEAGAKVHLTLNIFARDEDVAPMVEAAAFACDAGVDALIIADVGVLAAVCKALPRAEIHLSTQMSTLNAASARFWFDQGVRRIVLARELSLEQIKRMRDALPPECELELFAHGAVCMAYSGRCALSRYMTGRDANRGDCAQACRWTYRLEEEKRPGEYIPVETDENGTALFSAGDLNTLARLPELCDAGVTALKIEGRMKNEYYVATVTGAYRRALDAIKQGTFDTARDALAAELDCVSHRPYDTGFLFGPPQRPGGQSALSQTREYVGLVEGFSDGLAQVRLKAKIAAGDALELVTPAGVTPFTAQDLQQDDLPKDVLNIPNTLVRVPVPVPCAAGDILRGPNRNHK